MVAPVYSGEYGGMDRLILTAKYGKTRCAAAKNTAALLSALLVAACFAAGNLLFGLAAYGRDGLDCSILFAPMEFVQGYIPFPITCAALLGYQVLLALTGAAGAVGVALLFSPVCNNQVMALAASAAALALPVLLPVAESSPMFRILVLAPVYHMQFVSIMSVEQMKGGALYAVFAVLAAAVLLALGFAVSRRAFANHQVS